MLRHGYMVRDDGNISGGATNGRGMAEAQTTIVPLRLMGGQLLVIIELPNQMTVEAWQQMMDILAALKPGYVQDETTTPAHPQQFYIWAKLSEDGAPQWIDAAGAGLSPEPISYQGADLFSHKVFLPETVEERFGVSERRTGMRIPGGGATRAEAIHDAEEALARLGMLAFSDKVDHILQERPISPRYQHQETITQFYHPNSVYGITPCTEEIARADSEVKMSISGLMHSPHEDLWLGTQREYSTPEVFVQAIIHYDRMDWQPEELVPFVTPAWLRHCVGRCEDTEPDYPFHIHPYATKVRGATPGWELDFWKVELTRKQASYAETTTQQ